MTLIFNKLLQVVKLQVHVKFRQGKCSGSWVIVVTEKKTSTMLETILPSLPRAVIIHMYLAS